MKIMNRVILAAAALACTHMVGASEENIIEEKSCNYFGSTGNTCCVAKKASFASLSTTLQNVINPGDPILFDKVTAVVGGISYNPTHGVFTFNDTGWYEVSFGVSGSQLGGLFAPMVDLHIMNSGQIECNYLDQMTSTTITVEIKKPGTKMQVVNSGDRKATLHSYNANGVTSFIFIKKL